MADKYIVKSDYSILRKKARESSKGDIFENNLMTITPLEILLPEGQSLVQSDSNFKFSYRTDVNLKRKHSKDNWIRTPEGRIEWTLEDIKDSPLSDESKIRIKPDYNSLRNFAYYGSAVEMVHATVNHVLMYFPGELYFSDDKFQAIDKNGSPIDIGTYYIVYNECEIDIVSDVIDESKIDNPYRYLCLSIDGYQLLRNDEIMKESGLTRSNFARNPDFCDEGILGTVEIDGREITVYVMDGRKFYLTTVNYKGFSIRPNQTHITEYFETIDEFESVLLNRQSNPIYKAIFETTVEQEDGYYYTMKPYVWPSINEWTPDMHSSAYYSYLMDLIALAEYHDEYDSNNIWRMMTHESIKNLDWTFFRENGNGYEDLSKIDSSRIEAMLQLYGRQYDGLKRYIDNIKNVNKITYDQKNNIPDYLLTDTVENAGFEAILPITTAVTTVTTEALYDGLSKGYNEVDANTFFMRNLKLNAPYINSVKGTREGIMAMLGVLGFENNEYEINEHVTIARGDKANYCQMDTWEIYGISGDSETYRCSECSYPDAIDVEIINTYKDSYPADKPVGSYYGIACKPIDVYDSAGTLNYRYVVPWYMNGEEYDGDLYFQCDGGWGKRDSIDVEDVRIMDKSLSITELTGDFIYDETQSRMKYAQDIDEMLNIFPSSLENGDICYVTDIATLPTAYNGVYSADTTVMNEFNTNPSHYFIIKDKTNYCVLGGDGWNYIPLADITGSEPSDAAQKVIYLETIKENTVGNNPHVAKREYDNGKRYVEYLDEIFKYNIEVSGFSYFSDVDVQSAITTYKFAIDKEYSVDNRKSEYFRREEQSDLMIYDENGNTHPLTEMEDFCPIFSGKTITSSGNCINPEGGNIFLEPSANSIINLKNIEIGFHQPDIDDAEFLLSWMDYLNNVVLNYVKQVIPSTAILSIKILGPIENECLGSLSVTPTYLKFEREGGNATITITAKGQGWTISDIPEWIHLSQTTGDSGTTVVTVLCEENEGTNERNGAFNVKGTQTGRRIVQCNEAGEEEIRLYGIGIESVDGKSVNAFAPRYCRAYLYTYNSYSKRPENIIAKEDITKSCIWEAAHYYWPYEDEPIILGLAQVKYNTTTHQEETGEWDTVKGIWNGECPEGVFVIYGGVLQIRYTYEGEDYLGRTEINLFRRRPDECPYPSVHHDYPVIDDDDIIMP